MYQTLLSVALLAATALGQTFTSCNPLNSTCPADPALGTVFYDEFNSSTSQFDPRFWNITAGTDLISFGNQGAELTIVKEGDSVTLVSAFYIMWGQVEIIFQAAQGTGIISTLTLLSDDLDEIDWEIMGGNTTTVENNWYGWGNMSQMNAQYPAFDNAPGNFVNYTVNYSQEQTQWIIDGNVVRTIPYAAPGEYPQTPMLVKFGVWAAGAPGQPKGTQEWAGGVTDFSKGPFTMYVKSIKITDGSTNVTSYSYGNNSGSWQSIKAVEGESEAYKAMNELTTVEEAKKKWNGLSSGAKIGIACGVLGAFALGLFAFSFYFVKQRRQGQAEKAIADKEFNAQREEVMQYRDMMKKGSFAVSSMGHGQRF